MPKSVQLYCPTDPTFPAGVSSNGRSIVDRHGNAWLMVGDTAFGLVGALSLPSDWDLYLGTRASQGFNCVYMNYIFGAYDSGLTTWKTPDGVPPFLKSDGVTPGTGPGDYDIRYPNPVYVSRVDTILDKAAALGIMVVINPADAAVVDQPDNSGFIAGQGVVKCTAYGNWLGSHFGGRTNVAWQHGNDYGLSAQVWDLDSYLGAIANGIRAAAPNHLQSIELNYNTSTSYDNPNWGPTRTYPLNWNAVYDYTVVYDHVLKAYNGRSATPGNPWTSNNNGTATGLPVSPTYFVEGVYERPLFTVFDTGTPWSVRMIAYYTICCGGVGGFYGNGLVFPFSSGWQGALTDPGANHVGFIGRVFRAGNWHRLVPDGQTPSFLTAQGGTFTGGTSSGLMSQAWSAGAVTPEGDFGVVYCPTNQSLTIDMTKMRSTVTARWWDPTLATYQAIGTTFPNTGTHTFTAPTGAHSDGAHDWLLVLTA